MLIALVWLMIYASDPLYMYYAHFANQFVFRWDKVFSLWGYTSAFLFMFLIHHYVLIPTLLLKKHVRLYITGVVSMVVLFTTLLIFLSPEMISHDEVRYSISHAHESLNRPAKPGLLLAPPDLARVVMALMMIVADLGGLAWFNDQKLQQRLLQLEKQALNQELIHLRYQINPHFFMNTLNNIHALVDIDQERAKRAIVELSGMMRYSLYEGSDSMAPLQHEIEFLKLYISLMKLRYNNKIILVCDMPSTTPTDIAIPPLLLATFIENAFKYGISYQHPSYIGICLDLEEGNRKIYFRCENSRHITSTITNDGHHGIGLANVRKRLDLQYKDQYELKIVDDDPEKYIVELTIPTKVNTLIS